MEEDLFFDEHIFIKFIFIFLSKLMLTIDHDKPIRRGVAQGES